MLNNIKFIQYDKPLIYAHLRPKENSKTFSHWSRNKEVTFVTTPGGYVYECFHFVCLCVFVSVFVITPKVINRSFCHCLYGRSLTKRRSDYKLKVT